MKIVLSMCVWIAIVSFLSACQPSVDLMIEQGRIATQENHLDLAIDTFDQILALPNLTDEQAYKAKWGKSEILRHQKNLSAQSVLLEEIFKNPKFVKYQSVILDSLEENLLIQAQKKSLENIEESIVILRKLLQVKPDSADGNRMLAEILLAQVKVLKQEGKDFEPLLNECAALLIYDEGLSQSIQREKQQVQFVRFIKSYQGRFDQVKKESLSQGFYDESAKSFVFKGQILINEKIEEDQKAQAIEKAKAQAFEKHLQQINQVLAKFEIKQVQIKNEIWLVRGAEMDPSKQIKKKKSWETQFRYDFLIKDDLLFQAIYQVQ